MTYGSPLPKRALFPVSVGSPLFSSPRTREAIAQLPLSEGDECLFLIADELQVFNRARDARDGASLSAAVSQFYSRNRDRSEKSSWLNRILRALELPFNCRLLAWGDLTDRKFHRIHRALSVAFVTVPAFRGSVRETAAAFLHGRFGSGIPNQWYELAELYLLEEFSANVRVRAHEGVAAEYYLGTLHTPLVELLHGNFGLDVWKLAGVEKPSTRPEFYEYRPVSDSAHSWVSVEPPAPSQSELVAQSS